MENRLRTRAPASRLACTSQSLGGLLMPFRRSAGLLGVLIAICLTVACTSGDAGEGGDSAEPSAPRLEAPNRSQLAEGVRLGDQTDQVLYGVAADDETVVAGGYDLSANTQRPLFAVSTDAGETWNRGEVDAESVPEDLGNSMVDDVAGGDDGFVATGWREDGQPALWHSEDGADWRLTDVDGEAFSGSDWTEAVTWADGRFYVVGGSSRGVGRANDRLVVWTSEDGSTWRRTNMSSAMRGIVGTPSAADIAAVGDRVLVAGGVEDNNNREQPNRMALWLSGDAGRSFDLASTEPDLGGDYRAYSVAVEVVDGEFHVAASGDGGSYALHGQSSWDPVVVSRRHGHWTTVEDHVLASPLEEQPTAMVTVDGRWVMASRTFGEKDDAGVYAGGAYPGLAQVRHPSLRGPGQQRVEDAASVGEAGVLVGWTSRSGSHEPVVWRFEDAAVRRIELPEELSEGEPAAQPFGLVRARDRFVAVGDAQSSPVAWHSADFDTWQSVGLEGRDDHIPSVQVTGVAARRDGRVIAVGSRSRGSGDDAMVWVREPGDDWTAKQSKALTERSRNGYGSIAPSDVAVRGRIAVIAANGYTDGVEELHPLFSRDGGESWEAADGTGRLELSEQDVQLNRTEWNSFRAPVNGSIGATSVIRSDRTWVMGGYRSETAEGARPTVWLSNRGETWGTARALPMPPKAYGSSVNRLFARGRLLIATGSVERSESDELPGWVSWTSRDEGRTWRIGQVHRASSVHDLVALPDRVLALGSSGASRTSDAQVWSTADGREWEEADIDLEHGAGGGRQQITSGVVDGDQLRLLVVDIPPEGGGVYPETVPIPEP